MPSPPRLRSLLLALLLLTLPGRARALEVLASDRGGVTLELRVESFTLGAPGEDGRAALEAPGLEVWTEPGRPQLPSVRLTLGLPPGSHAQARVLEQEEESREGVRLTLGPEPFFTQPAEGGQPVPALRPAAPILDGPYPESPAVLGEPLQMHGQRLVGLRLTPFSYDEAGGRLVAYRRIRVRVDFVADGGLPPRSGLEPPAVEDRHFEGVFQASLLNYEQARAWREPRVPAQRRGFALARAADETRPEARVRVDSAGVYRVDFTQLAAAGYPANIPIAEVEAHRHEYLPGLADPPFINVPVPIELVDDGDNVFGAGDYILFYAQNFVERARATHYQSIWGKQDVVFVSSTALGGAARIQPRPGNRGFGLTVPEPWFPSFKHYERSFNFMSYPPDTSSDLWYWTTHVFDGNPSPPDSFKFECHDLDTTARVVVTPAWQGWLFVKPHQVWADVVRGDGVSTNVVDSLYWTGKGRQTPSAALFGSSVSEGATNRLRIRGFSSATERYSLAAFDYFEVTYGRRYRALNDYLPCNSSTAQGPALFKVGNLSAPTDIRVYDVTDSTAPVKVVPDPGQITPGGAGYAVEFEDDVAPGTRRTYVVFRAARTVPNAYVTAVNRRGLTAPPPGGRVDYLVVTHEAFEAALAPLVAHRQSLGLSTRVAPAQAIYDEFNGGRKSAYAIRRLAQFAYNNWGTKFLLLVGDASLDPIPYRGKATVDYLPAPVIMGPVGISQGKEIVTSDHWYVWCLNGGCSGPGNNPTYQLPDLYVGRLPASSAQEAQDLVAKILSYEQFSTSDAWRSRVVLSADDPYSEQTFLGEVTPYCRHTQEFVFRDIAEKNRQVILGEGRLRGTQIVPFHLYNELGNQPCSPCAPDTCRELNSIATYTQSLVTPRLASLLSAGALMWDYQGHANAFQMAHERLWLSLGSTQDINRVTNNGKPFFFTGYACHINSFTELFEVSFGDGMGERFMTAPGRGAIATFASTGFEILPFTKDSHLDVALVRALFAKPPFDPYLGDRGARVVLGEAIATAYVRFIPTAPFSEAGVSQTYVLLGDPALRMTVAGPQSFVTANGDTVQDGQNVRLHSPGDTLRLVAEIASNVAINAILLEYERAGVTDTIPPARYTLTPSFPDTLVNGGRFYTLSLKDTLEAASYTYRLRTTDRYGLATVFRVPFEYTTLLRVDGAAIADGDVVAPDANLSLLVLVPKPVNPETAGEVQLTVGGQPQAFSFAPEPGDASGREWVLSWLHQPYPKDVFDVAVTIGGETRTRSFRVTGGPETLQIEQVAAFPNPFEDELGCHISFSLNTGARSDLMLRVFTVTGRLVYERQESGLAPGYHQMAWSGLDAEGNKLANGTYLYRLIARNPQAQSVFTGRLVKLRKPKRTDESVTP